MGTQPKSKAVAEYRRQIALYLKLVGLTKGWKLVTMGERAGGLKHTTISRAMKEENTLGFPALLALEAASGVEIPGTLRSAAIAAQQPAFIEGPSAADLRRITAEFESKSPEYQRALIEELQRSLAKSA